METSGQDFVKDEQLIGQYLETRDRKVLGLIYQRYYASTLSYCLHFTKKREDALDITQEVFLKVFDNIENLNNPVTFASWLHRITKNTCINYCRNRQQETFCDLDQMPSLASEVTDNEGAQRQEQLRQRTLASIDNLPGTTRQILLLKYLENYSLKELEQKFLLGESAIKMRLLRAKQTLKNQVEKGLGY